MKACTLLFLLRNDEILLAMKKRGFGSGLWNGVGGKVEPNETLEQALVRECQEEISVTPLSFIKVAIHEFVFPEAATDMGVHAYFCREWKGEPAETEEMAPQWFRISEIPYNDMWQDDVFWLPAVLNGKKLRTKFAFDKNDELLGSQIQVVDRL